MRISIEVGEPGGRPDRDNATACDGPAVVINIDASASAELRPSEATPAGAPLNAGGAPAQPGPSGGGAQAGAYVPASSGLVFSAGPAPLLAEET